MEALEEVKAAPFDLVFMDHMMPGMDGIEATGRIRDLKSEYPYLENIPIIALSANAVLGTKETFLHNGFNDFLSKPIDTAKLDKILEKWLPKEKQKCVSEEYGTEGDYQQHKSDEISNISIAAIDTEKGRVISGGTVALYLDVLSAFYQDGQSRTKTINHCLDSGDIDLYRVHVHGLKSALFNIGADALSEAAKALEAATEISDMDFIHSHNAAFLSDLDTLLEDINVCLSKQAANESTAAGFPDMDRFKDGLVRLSDALASMDRGEMNNALADLHESAPNEAYATAVKVIANKIILAEYDEAEELAESLKTIDA